MGTQLLLKSKNVTKYTIKISPYFITKLRYFITKLSTNAVELSCIIDYSIHYILMDIDIKLKNNQYCTFVTIASAFFTILTTSVPLYIVYMLFHTATVFIFTDNIPGNIGEYYKLKYTSHHKQSTLRNSISTSITSSANRISSEFTN